ncbi:hypothetical protein F5X99DRAFT_233768 [Biscogniauxia marginata]|nr:hypothetical protein F5X99DRAFT_233768 [Biscogniauxia marginata]
MGTSKNRGQCAAAKPSLAQSACFPCACIPDLESFSRARPRKQHLCAENVVRSIASVDYLGSWSSSYQSQAAITPPMTEEIIFVDVGTLEPPCKEQAPAAMPDISGPRRTTFPSFQGLVSFGRDFSCLLLLFPNSLEEICGPVHVFSLLWPAWFMAAVCFSFLFAPGFLSPLLVQELFRPVL